MGILKSRKASRLKFILRNYFRKRTMYHGNRFLRPLTQERLSQDLNRLGLGRGDLVCVHSSFSALGYVEGGAKTFIRALKEVVGASGTIMMPTFSMRGSMVSYLESGQTFNVLTTPSRNGMLTEAFRTWPGVERSLHPTNSVAAKGPLAAELLQDHECSPTPYGHDTPFGRLAPFGGKILMINTHIHSFLHHVQELVDFPNLFLNGLKPVNVVDAEGRELTVETRVMRPRIPYYIILPGTEGHEVDYAILHDYALMFPERRESIVLQAGFRLNNHADIWGRREKLKTKGIFRTGEIGAAQVGLLETSPFLNEIRPELESLLTRYRLSYCVEKTQDLNLPYL